MRDLLSWSHCGSLSWSGVGSCVVGFDDGAQRLDGRDDQGAFAAEPNELINHHPHRSQHPHFINCYTISPTASLVLTALRHLQLFVSPDLCAHPSIMAPQQCVRHDVHARESGKRLARANCMSCRCFETRLQVRCLKDRYPRRARPVFGVGGSD